MSKCENAVPVGQTCPLCGYPHAHPKQTATAFTGAVIVLGVLALGVWLYFVMRDDGGYDSYSYGW